MDKSDKSVVKGTPYSEVEELKRQRNREAAARYRDRNRALVNQRIRDWRNANRKKAREQSREWRNRKLANCSPEVVTAFRAMESAKTIRLQAVCSDAVFTAYG